MIKESELNRTEHKKFKLLYAHSKSETRYKILYAQTKQDAIRVFKEQHPGKYLIMIEEVKQNERKH